MNTEIEITWKRVIRIWWSFFWRNLIAIAIAMIIGGIVGFILGFIMGALGVSSKVIQMITAPIGALIGLAISLFPLKMILGKDFGDFRLILVSSNPPDIPDVLKKENGA